MTIPELLQQIAQVACPGYHWYYDIRQMQNVEADNAHFPAVWMEEYYAERSIVNGYTRVRELAVEVHFQDLVPMQGVAIDREKVREALRKTGVEPFVNAYNVKALKDGWPEVQEWQADPEPPMFDANATGVLLRFIIQVPDCMEL